MGSFFSFGHPRNCSLLKESQCIENDPHYSACLWCNSTKNNSTSITGQCLNMDEYCDDEIECDGQIIWKKETYDGCPDYLTQNISLFIILLLLCCTARCILPYCAFGKRYWHWMKDKSRVVGPCTWCIIAVPAIYGILFILESIASFVIMMFNIESKTFDVLWWLPPFLYPQLLAMIIDATLIFGVISYYAIKRLIKHSQKPVHTYCLVAIYLFWWIIFAALFGMGMYAAIAHEEIIHTMGYVSLGAVWLDLWHPVRLIQKQNSIRIINKATFVDESSLNETSIVLSNLSDGRDGTADTRRKSFIDGMPKPKLGSIQRSEKNPLKEKKKRRRRRTDDNIQCDLKYWEFFIFSAWIGVFITLTLSDLHHSTCWLSCACVLPTIVNVWLFWKYDSSRFRSSRRVFLMALLIVIVSLVILFTVFSCTCAEDEPGVCEWAHIMVIASVMLFVFVHLHQKSKSH